MLKKQALLLNKTQWLCLKDSLKKIQKALDVEEVNEKTKTKHEQAIH